MIRGKVYSVLSLNESLKTSKVIFMDDLYNGHFEKEYNATNLNKNLKLNCLASYPFLSTMN